MLLRLIKPKQIHGTLRDPGYEFEFPQYAAFALIGNGDAIRIERYTRRSSNLPSMTELSRRADEVDAILAKIDGQTARALAEPVLNDPLPPDEDEPEAPADAPDEDEDAPEPAPVDEGDDAARIRGALDSKDYNAMVAIAKEYNLAPPEGRTNWRKSEVIDALTELMEAAQ